MSCNSAIYAANTNNQAITAANPTTINFGQVVRAFGPNTDISGGNITIQNVGYYVGDTNFTFTAAAGLVTIQIYIDGIAIPGAVASATATADDLISVSIPFMVRSTCCSEKTITATINSVGAAVVSNAAIVLHKI